MTARISRAAVAVTVPDDARLQRQRPAREVGRRGVDSLTRTTTALATNTVVTSAFGLAFWLLASHRYTPQQVGSDSALLSGMLLLTTVTELNFSTALPRFLPQVRQRRQRVVRLCYGATAAAAALSASVFTLVVPHFVPRLRFLLHDRVLTIAFIVGLVVFNIFAVQDAVLVASRRAGVVPVKSAVFGVVKLVVMVALVGSVGGHGIFVSWLVAALCLVVPVNALLFGRILRQPDTDVGQQTIIPIQGRRNVLRYLAHDWMAGIVGQGTADLLPLIVLAVLGRAVTGYFYIAFIVATAVATFSQSFTTSLLVEGAHDESALDRLTHRTIVRCTIVVVPGIVAATIVAPFVLRLFGPQYSAQAAGVFRLLLLATVPQTAVAIAMSAERIRGRADRVLRYQVLTAVAGLSLVVPLIHATGIAGVGWAWLGAQCITAAFVAPTLRRVLRNRRRARSVGGST